METIVRIECLLKKKKIKEKRNKQIKYQCYTIILKYALLCDQHILPGESWVNRDCRTLQHITRVTFRSLEFTAEILTNWNDLKKQEKRGSQEHGRIFKEG